MNANTNKIENDDSIAQSLEYLETMLTLIIYDSSFKNVLAYEKLEICRQAILDYETLNQEMNKLKNRLKLIEDDYEKSE